MRRARWSEISAQLASIGIATEDQKEEAVRTMEKIQNEVEDNLDEELQNEMAGM